MVLDKILEINKVINTPSKITNKTIMVEIIEEVNPLATVLPIKIVLMVIKKGNLPLQGTKLLVKMAINFSRGESIILAPTTPAALQPNPMHIVNACFPRTTSLLKKLI